MSEPFGLVVHFTLKGGAAAAFDRLAAATVEQIRMCEPATLLYAVHAVESQPQTRVFYELYRDRDAFEEHESQPHVRRFLAEREKYLDGFDVSVLSLLAVKGLPDPSQHT